MKDSKIAWTDHTFNPWIGCQKVAAGCANCYAEALEHRWGRNSFGPGASRRSTSAAYWKGPEAWNRSAAKAGRRSRVFCGSMCDVCEDRPELETLRRLLVELIAKTPNLDWLLLTKRPENINCMFGDALSSFNAHFGASASTQDEAELACRELSKVSNSGIKFLSLEPLVEEVDLVATSARLLDWIIVGGESGPRARSCDTGWIRTIVEDCAVDIVNAPVFVKQLGRRATNCGVPLGKFGDAANSEPMWWPVELRVRNVPAAFESSREDPENPAGESEGA